MTIHYHGTPITPNSVLLSLAGKNFCVSHANPQQVSICHDIGQSIMLDNGAFTAWTQGKATNWPAYYQWCDVWLNNPTTWAVIPDAIDAGAEVQDDLIKQWPHGDRGVPVWHMDEPIERLLSLLDAWPMVCMGSAGEFAKLLTPKWEAGMDDAWEAITKRHNRTPKVHMLRGMQMSRLRWPFYSVDSTDIARNHNRHKQPKTRAEMWDACQCPPVYLPRPVQMEFA